jgi:DNA-binding MarR family transcriptional regulator
MAAAPDLSRLWPGAAGVSLPHRRVAERQHLRPRRGGVSDIAEASTAPTAAVVRVAAFRAALRSFLRESEQSARANGLTPQRHLLLLMIKGAPDGSEQTTIGDLAERMKLAQSSVTELVSRAERAGLVQRQQWDADARVAHLRLTEEGERRLASVFKRLHLERARLQEAFGEASV